MPLKTSSVEPAPPPPVGRFCAAVLTCASLAAAFPALALWSQTKSVQALAFAGGASFIAIVLIAVLLLPLGAVARGLRDCLAEETPSEPVQAKPEGAGGLVGAAVEISTRMEVMRQRLTNRHPTTGLPTREPFLAEVMGDIERAADPVVLGVVRFNDYDRLAAFDQRAADLALAAFAARLRASIPVARPVAQTDRDCFAIWFRGVDQKTATQQIGALTYVLTQELPAEGLTLAPTVAIGAAVFPQDGTAPGELLTRAVAALESGRQGGEAIAFYSEAGSDAAREQFALEQDLRGAVARDELVLHYQPLVDIETRTVVGAEALVRWQHPTLGLIAPGRFIPILERSPMMAEVGLWVLNAACRAATVWRAQGLDLKVAVNLSPVQCRDPRLTDIVMRTLDRHGLPSSSLELELTETAAMEDADAVRRLLGELRGQGVSVAIDDFGAGYSSLSYLKNLPFSKLKIDREFVDGVNLRTDSRAICAALIALSKGLDIALLAEGVETAEEVQTLRAMGCRLFQGYYFARPMEADVFARTVRNPAWLTRLSIGEAPTGRAAAE